MTEYRGNKVAVFDTKTEKMTEWPICRPIPIPTAPQSTRTARSGPPRCDRPRGKVDPKTGATIEYLMPKETNMRSVFVDNSTTPITFWTGSAHGAALVKVEPLN